MKIYISAKQLRKRGNQVAGCPYELKTVPNTLRELLSLLVLDGVNGYHQRLQAKEGASILTRDDMDSMSQVGKIGFGIPFGSGKAKLDEALETAILGFEDGLYRIFLGEQEIESLDEALQLQEDDTITIIRLVMLTGGCF